MMKLGSLFLVPALLAVWAEANLMMTPPDPTTIRDISEGKSSPLVIYCAAKGKTVSEAQLKWYDNNDVHITATGGSIFISDMDGKELMLRIAKPTEADAGRYTCKGIINGEEEQISKQVTFFSEAKVLSPSEQYLVNGTDDKIMCETKQGNTEASISWYQISDSNGWTPIRRSDPKFFIFKPEAGNEGTDYLLVHNVTLDDEATYICNIDLRMVGRSDPFFINVKVTVPPEFTTPLTVTPLSPKEGDHLDLRCEATGIPAPKYTFKKDGEILVNGSVEGHYVIKNVSRFDEGSYVCEASNQGGTEAAAQTVDVIVPPEIEDSALVAEEENQPVELSCVATGDPAPTLTWRLKGSVDVITNDTNERIHVREDSGDMMQNPVTKVYRRTLTLVIPEVQPSDAATYECSAQNQAGSEQETFQIDVTYTPIFDDNADSHFYGWVGSNTNLTCIANGNPLPEIFWYKDDMELKKDLMYDISPGDSGLPTRAISYLTPFVDEINQGTIFGDYKCEARNDLGKNEVELKFLLAVAPEEPELNVLSTKATGLILDVIPPLNDGGQPVTMFSVKYKQANSTEDMLVKNVTLLPGEQQVEVELDMLTPNTAYIINVSAVNNVGSGQERAINWTTADVSRPEPVTVTSSREGKEASTYLLTWSVPSTGGAEIKTYKVVFAVAEEVNTDVVPWTAEKVSSASVTLNVDGQTTTEVNIKNLVKDTYYQVKIKAVNRIGSSDVSTFIFKTGLGRDSTGRAGCVQASVTGLLLVVMVTVYRHLFC